MKLFSRKALLAVATATAVTTGAMTAPTAMAEQSSAAATTQQSAAASTSPSESEDANSGSGELRGMSRDDKGKISAKKIGEWIGIIGTILTVITSVITFMGKIPNFNFGR